jgi:hypothetical protein
VGLATLTSTFSPLGYMGSGDQFPNPFMDVASLAMPGTLRNALYWSEYVYSVMGTYRMAMERVISYFLTEVQIEQVSQDEREKWTKFLNDTLDILTITQNLLRDRMCFHGDVRAVTKGGIFKLRDLAGETVEVLSRDGVYRPAEFRSFGRQELLEVEFSDGRTVLATPEHRWVVKNLAGKETILPTSKLSPGHRVPRTVAPRPAKDDDYREGVRHGFTFGDGSLYNDGRQAAAYFFGDKDSELLDYFAGHGGAPVGPDVHGKRIVHGLPPHYKSLPENERSAGYWYGFVSGFLAADGSVDTHGCALLTQKARATLEAVGEQLPRIGMAAGPLRGHRRVTRFLRQDGRVDEYEGTMHALTLLKRFMRPDDFLLGKHRDKFVTNYRPTKYGEHVAVASVKRTGVVDEVFCCVEMQTHTFVIDNAVLTANCYGNAFASVIVPFKRFLGCPKCGSHYPLKEVYENRIFQFQWSMPKFVATCPRCKTGANYRGPWKVVDEPDDEEKKIKIKRWSPHDIELLHDPYTEDVDFLWRIPEDYKRLVRQGNLYHLERASEKLIDAVHKNQMFRFNPDTVYHMKEPHLAGVLNRGWGIPRIFANFRQIYYVQVLHRFNEAIALDYVIPFRLITPGVRQGASVSGGQTLDPLLMYNGGDFGGQVRGMIRRRRRDPASWQVLPFPVNYQMLGAEANQLAPRDLLDQGTETLLNDAGTPVELYKGSLQLQTAPVALRLFESTWHHLMHDVNAMWAWVVRQVGQILSWEAVEAKLKRVTIADDMQKQMAALQMYMSQQLSGTTALAGLGFDWLQEQKQISEESRQQAELQSRTQEEMEQAGFAQQIAKGQQPAQGGGGPPPGGGQGGPPPAGQGGGGGQGGAAPDATTAMGTSMGGPVSDYLASLSPNVPVTPQEMMSVADSMAQQLLGMPESQKDSELRKLKTANQTLHSLVKARLEQIRRDTKSQAGNAAMAQLQQGGGQPAG